MEWGRYAIIIKVRTAYELTRAAWGPRTTLRCKHKGQPDVAVGQAGFGGEVKYYLYAPLMLTRAAYITCMHTLRKWLYISPGPQVASV